MSKCFMCGIETMDQLERSPLPKELMELDDANNLAEDLHPICKKCNDFRRIVDSHFITLCEDAKLFEWYRSDSKKRGEYFPPTFIYNIPIERLRELYYEILTICEEADKTASNNILRDERKEQFNYEWRKRDA